MRRPSVLISERSEAAAGPEPVPPARMSVHNPAAGPARQSTVLRIKRLVAVLVAGRGNTVVIEGEPGVGKSTMLASGLSDAAAKGCLVFRGAVDPADAELTLSPDGGGEPTLRIPASGSGVDAVEQVLAAVERMCDSSPVILALDDLHRADPGTLLLWHRLSRAARRLPLMLVATARPAPSRTAGTFDRLRRALADEGAVLLRLEPLSPVEVADTAAALLGAAPGAQLRRRLESAGGNPAYVLDLIESLRQSGAIRIEGRIAEAVAGAAGPVPPALVEAVCARLAPLSADALEALRLASLLGEEFTGRELAAICDREPHELLAVLDEVIPAGVLIDSGPRLRFRHTLVCQALYHSMRETRRSALHRSAAEALDEAGSPVERVAEQLLTAAALAQGWPAEWLAAKADELTFRAPELAVELFRRAIDHAAPDDPARVLFEEKLAAAMYLLGRSDCAPAALGLLEYRADPVRRTTWAFMSGNALNRVGKYAQGLDAVDEGVAVLESAVGDLPEEFTVLWSARFTGLRAQLMWSQRRLDEAGALADRALAEGARMRDPLAQFYGAHINSLLTAGAGDVPGALARMEQGLAALGERWRLADQRLLLMMNQAVALGRLDRTAEAHSVLERAYEVAERCGVTWRMAGIVSRSVTFFYLDGQWDEALAAIRRMIDRPDAEKQRSILASVRLLVLMHRGRLSDAREYLAAGLGESEGLDGRLHHLPILAAALFAEAEDRIGDAVAAMKPALLGGVVWDLDERHWCLPVLTRLALTVGDTETARAAVAVAEAEAGGQVANLRRHVAAQRCRGLLDQDPKALAEAAEYYRRVGMPLMLAQTREDAAVVAAQLDDPEAARRHLEAAAEDYHSLGAAFDLARAEARLREFGVRRGRRTGRARPESGWEALTPAEEKVAFLVAEGSSNPEIADLLYLSPRTVQTHVSHILAKLGVHSRSEIAREAARRAS
jgi:DNA-binding CsgD family transcriptional regulator